MEVQPRARVRVRSASAGRAGPGRERGSSGRPQSAGRVGEGLVAAALEESRDKPGVHSFNVHDDVTMTSHQDEPGPAVTIATTMHHLDNDGGGGEGSEVGGLSSPAVPPEPVDLQQLLQQTEGETDLDSDHEIPPLFSKTVLDAYPTTAAVEEEGGGGLGLSAEVKAYLEQFTASVEGETLVVGSLPLDQLKSAEERLQSERLARQREEEERHRTREAGLLSLRERARKDVGKSLKRRRRALQQRESRAVQSGMAQQKSVRQAFNRAEGQMLAALKARKAEIKALYGDLERADGYYGAVRGRRWKVDWNRAPQPVQIRIQTLRGVRDKLPASRYVLLVSLYDRLGGVVLHWSSLKGQQWGAATLPVHHPGHYHSTEIKFTQSVYAVLPSRRDVRPSMVLCFELFLLRGGVAPTDRVVAWGAFPICDADFNIIDGRFKCPLLRGCVDPGVDSHSRLERLLSQDLHHWLANLYFTVTKLPRYLAGMQEFEVELQFTSGLLGNPDRIHDDADVVDGNEPIYGEEEEAMALVRPQTVDNVSVSHSILPGSQSSVSKSQNPIPGSNSGPVPSRAALHSRLSRRLHTQKQQQQTEVDTESSSSSEEEDDMGVVSEQVGVAREEEGGFLPVQDNPGLYYKVHTFDPVVERQKQCSLLLPQTQLLGEEGLATGRKRRRGRGRGGHLEELSQHTFSVQTQFSEQGGGGGGGRGGGGRRERRQVYQRLQYVGRQFLSETGLARWRSLEFWAMLLMLVVCWWLRLYLHYGAQYALLKVTRIPVNRFEFHPHTVLLHYQSSLLFTREEVGLVLVGPLSSTVLFALLVAASWLLQKLGGGGGLPDLLYLFIAAFGIQAILDPYWVLLVDVVLQRYHAPSPTTPTADMTKLYWHFSSLEGSGVVGIFLTLFLYIFTTFTTLTCFYMYFLRVHMNGRLIDVYHRLRSAEEAFFVPHDLEVSLEELGFVCRGAEQWRGAEGERRKIAVCDYVWGGEEEEEASPSGDSPSVSRGGWRREVTTHLSIHTLHLDGLRELHRHFLRTHSGSITEVFGELSSVPGVCSGVKQALAGPAHPQQAPPTSVPGV